MDQCAERRLSQDSNPAGGARRGSVAVPVDDDRAMTVPVASTRTKRPSTTVVQ